MRKISYRIEDKPKLSIAFPLAFQHVLSAFTGQIAVGMLLAMGFGLNVKETALLIQCALLITGIATMIQSFGVTKFIGAKLPIVAGGSFTLISPMVVAANTPGIGIGGAFGAALVGSAVLFLIGPIAIKFLHKHFTTTVTGAVVLTVGVCIGATGFNNFNPQSPTAMMELMIGILVVAIIVALNFLGKGLIKQCCILIGMIVGYIIAAVLGMVDFSPIGEAAWFSLVRPFEWGISFNLGAILTICAVHIGTMMEMIGDTTGVVTAAEDRLPTGDELARTIRGGGLASCIASALNGAPVITGSANVGIVAMTGVASRFVTGLGGIILLVFAVFPKLAQLLALIPNCVMAGAVLVMCGQIAASGLRIIGMSKFTDRNTTILAISLAVGIGGNFGLANLSFLPPTITTICTGIPGTALVALLLNILLPKLKEDREEEDEVAEQVPTPA